MPNYYWGEVNVDKARKLLDAARKESWTNAVRVHFPDDEDMTVSLLDLQRASWAPMLGLDQRSVALDIGSGYGAITHSISRLVGELYSIEAIPERIEFTQERLRQEGINNVRLIQASAVALPLVEKSFDLVVTNGVLEWVGEWDTQDDARRAQLKFLRTIQRCCSRMTACLSSASKTVSGIRCFFGECDHSGIAYTEPCPAPHGEFHAATQFGAPPPHTIEPWTEYRTFTYSAQGYRKLLREAGFANVSCRWAEPGYNQPYHLTPLAKPQWIREQFLDLLDHPSPSPQKGWRRWLKRNLAFSSMLRLVLPELATSRN